MAQGALIYVIGPPVQGRTNGSGSGGGAGEHAPTLGTRGAGEGPLALLTGVEHLSSAISSRGRLLFFRDGTDNAVT